jgi:hypothetical protein
LVVEAEARYELPEWKGAKGWWDEWRDFKATEFHRDLWCLMCFSLVPLGCGILS